MHPDKQAQANPMPNTIGPVPSRGVSLGFSNSLSEETKIHAALLPSLRGS